MNAQAASQTDHHTEIRIVIYTILEKDVVLHYGL